MLGTFLLDEISEIEKETNYIYQNVILPNWCSENLHGFPNTLYGAMMLIMSKIDLVSSYWDISSEHERKKRGHQTKRMVNFLNVYVNPDQSINEVLVLLWRHTLMHTGSPRVTNGYSWLLHWKEHLPREQHYTLMSNILNIALIYLVEDLKQGISQYLKDLENNTELQKYFYLRQIQLGNR